MGDLDGKAALVTGGSRGIGRAICLELARHGARVAVTYQSNAALADAVVADITAGGGEAFAIRGDVADGEAAAALVKETVDRFGGLDVRLTNVGGEVVQQLLA